MPIPRSKTRGVSPWLAHGAALSWTALVFLLLLIPGNGMDTMPHKFPWTLPTGTDKLVHGLLFFFETRFLFHSFNQLRPGRFSLMAAIGAAILLGALTETAQLWVPMRDGSGADLLADIAGALACGLWVSRPLKAGSRSIS